MQEKKGAVTFQGAPLTISGNEIKVGDSMPDITLIDNDLKPVKLSSFKGKVMLILSVPSLDTDVCSKESHRIDKEVSSWGGGGVTLVVSKDLPFAQKRWCGAMGAKSVKTLSDYKDGEFGQKFGVYVKEIGLLARAVFVVDQKGIVRYVHLVKEITNEPPYDEILAKAKQLQNGAK